LESIVVHVRAWGEMAAGRRIQNMLLDMCSVYRILYLHCGCVCGCGCVYVSVFGICKQIQTQAQQNTYGKINAHINKKDIVRKTRCARTFIYGPHSCCRWGLGLKLWPKQRDNRTITNTQKKKGKRNGYIGSRIFSCLIAN